MGNYRQITQGPFDRSDDFRLFEKDRPFQERLVPGDRGNLLLASCGESRSQALSGEIRTVSSK